MPIRSKILKKFSNFPNAKFLQISNLLIMENYLKKRFFSAKLKKKNSSKFQYDINVNPLHDGSVEPRIELVAAMWQFNN